MAMQTVLLGGYVDEEVKKVNDNFSEIENTYAKQSDIPTVPTVPTKTSDLTNDSGFVTETALQSTLNGYVEGETGKGLSTNDYTTEDKNKVANLGKIDFTTSNFGTADSDGYYTASLSANGKYPVKVMRQNGSDYEEVLVHTKVSGSNIQIISKVAFAGYVVTV